ncbi:MAG: hypothetical protein RJA63_12 [Pseudomonadota bacterium]|jgi:hypothetical protein
MSPQRKALCDYKEAHKDIELTGAAISLLEQVNGMGRTVIGLKNKQHQHLARMDAAAAILGVPYEGWKR